MLSAEGSVTCTPASPLPEAGVSRTQSCSGLESNSGVFQPTEGNEGKREGKGRDGGRDGSKARLEVRAQMGDRGE